MLNIISKNTTRNLAVVTLAGIILVEIATWFAQTNPTVNAVTFGLLILVTIAATLFKPEYGLLILLTELFIGSQGRLLVVEGLSIRMALFLIVFAIWLGYRLRTRQLGLFGKYGLYAFLGFFIFVTVGVLQGLANNSELVFQDANAWAFFGLLFTFIDLSSPKFLHHVLTILITATSWLALKTIVSLILFSHAIANIGGNYYTWIRDTRIGEITYVADTLFRVFFQSHIFVLAGGLIVLSWWLLKGKDWTPITKAGAGLYIYLMTLTIIISQSRSYWVGGLVAILSLMALAIFKYKAKTKTMAIFIAMIIIMIFSQVYVLQWLTGSFGTNLVADRFSGLQSEAAGISRINQLQPLLFNIEQQLLFGYGFGKTLTYISQDPRIVATHPDGVYTTYAFEWGYLDIMLKIGALGLIAYLIVILGLLKKGLDSPATATFVIGLIAILATNIFSPYLNHPLGIGYILLTTALIKKKPD